MVLCLDGSQNSTKSTYFDCCHNVVVKNTVKVERRKKTYMKGTLGDTLVWNKKYVYHCVLSGATGFITQYVIDELLKTEKYKVIGSARSQEKADKLLSQFNNSNLSMEIVPNIAEPDAFGHIFAKYAKDIKVVLHTASPFSSNPKILIKTCSSPQLMAQAPF